MAHEIETNFVVGEAWHGLGIVETAPKTAQEALGLAGLDWKVIERPISLVGDINAIASHKALIRDTDSKVLGIVGNKYKPYQNSDLFERAALFVDNGLATFDAAASLKEGQVVYVSLKLGTMEITKGDAVNKYLLIAHGHNGKMAVHAGLTATRVVCSNTLTQSMNSKASQLIRVSHSVNVKANVSALLDCVNAANLTFEANADQYRALAARAINKNDLEKYVTKVFDYDMTNERSKIACENMTRTITRIFETQPKAHGNPFAGGTYWDAYNAVNYYLNHEQGNSIDSRKFNMLFGASRANDTIALNEALNLCYA